MLACEWCVDVCKMLNLMLMCGWCVDLYIVFSAMLACGWCVDVCKMLNLMLMRGWCVDLYMVFSVMLACGWCVDDVECDVGLWVACQCIQLSAVMWMLQQHRTGLAKKIWSLESPQDIEKWIQERKR